MSGRQDFPNGHLLMTPEGLHERLGDEKLVILDVRTTAEIVTSGWIPGAAHFDLYGIGLTQTPQILFEEWITMMRSLLALRGVSQDATVVVYEENSGMKAARAFWVMEYLGHQDVHVLDGGMRAWKDAGYPVSHEMKAPKPRSFKVDPQPDLFISADALKERLGEPGLCILDTRTDDEYYARNVRSARGGAIPGAVHKEWVHYLDEKGRFKPYEELNALFAGLGITDRAKPVVPY